jgi:hypothetical protein
MALARYEGVAQDSAGNVIPNATVEVRRDAPGRPVVPLFSDRNGTVPIGNPIKTDPLGKFSFHAPGGVYYVRVFTGPSQAPFQEYVRRYQALGTAAERDVEDLARVLESGTAGFSTIEELQAFVPTTTEGVLGKVLTGPGAGFYHYDDTQEEGEKWIKDRPLFDTFARLTVVDGTANSIEAELEDGIDDASVKLMALIPEETNTGPVTLNGLPLRDVSGAALIPGQLVAGRSYNLTDEGDHYRLRQESDVTGVPAAIATVAAAALGAIAPLVEEAEDLRSEVAEDRAQTGGDRIAIAADRAAVELAKDAALSGGTIYPDIATGRAASSATTGPDAYFKVLGSGDVSFRLYRRISSVSQTLVTEQPSNQAFTSRLGTQFKMVDLPPESGWLWALADAAGRAAIAVDREGKVYLNLRSGSSVPLGALGSEIIAKLLQGVGSAVWSTPESGWLFSLVDGAKRIGFGLRIDGTFWCRPDKAMFRPDLMPESAVVCLGDSFTAGAGGGGTTYPDVLAAALGRDVYGRGIGGQTSAAIATRFGGLPMLVSVAGDQVPASGPVTLTARSQTPITNQGAGSFTGRLAGVPGTLAAITSDGGATYTYSFTRTAAGDAVACPAGSAFVFDLAAADQKRTGIIWAGRNDDKSSRAAIAITRNAVLSMAKSFYAEQKRYLVVSVMTGTNEGTGSNTYNQVAALNAELKATFGERFVDLRRYLIDFGLVDAGLNPTANDFADIAADTVPRQLLSDGLHGTATFYTLAGNFLARQFNARGW